MHEWGGTRGGPNSVWYPGKPCRATLFGAFPELAAVTGDDIAWVKSLWQQSLDKQLRILQG